ncbi:hypothetical protein HOY80DRAFT_938350 [Tuber brumale]|nr:hypothetical protein HOY80DRAFT_938350 [Tuber brumale]
MCVCGDDFTTLICGGGCCCAVGLAWLFGTSYWCRIVVFTGIMAACDRSVLYHLSIYLLIILAHAVLTVTM